MDQNSMPPRIQYSKWAIGIVAAIALAMLLIDHRQHVLGVLPYLLLLACPLMHVFGHRHGDHHDRHSDR